MRTYDIRLLTKSCETWIHIMYNATKNYYLKKKQLDGSEFLR